MPDRKGDDRQRGFHGGDADSGEAQDRVRIFRLSAAR
jgi:hypothetical protein